MIYEYAVNPRLVIDWVLNRDVGLARHFGLDQRRLISDVADNWAGEEQHGERDELHRLGWSKF